MKKLLLVFISIAVVNGLSAQKTKIAIKGGLNYSTARVYYINEVTNSNIKQANSYKTGFGGGLYFDMHFDGALHFTPSLSYNQRGYSYIPTYGDTTKYDNTIHYFDIVPAISLKLKTGRKSAFYLSLGPELSLALAGTEKVTHDGITTSAKMPLHIDGEYGLIDMGATAGIGFHTRKFMIEALYQYGFANINNNAELDHRNIRNRMFSFNIGYFIK